MMNDRGRNLGGDDGGVVGARSNMRARMTGDMRSRDAEVDVQNNGTIMRGAETSEQAAKIANDIWSAPRVGEVGSETASELTRMARGETTRTSAEMAKEGIFSADSPEMDLTGNGEVTDTERMMYADTLRDAGLKAPSLITFNNKGQEKLSDEAVEAVETAIREVGDNMSELNTIVDDLSWTLVLNAYGRHRGDGLKS